jgi:hypothetical protein
MPRYFFHLLEESDQNLVRDAEGISFSGVAEARKEAIGLARDIAEHGLHQSTWQVVVTDANAAVVLAVPLSEIRPHKMKAGLDLARRISMYEPKFRSHIFTWLVTAAVFVMFVQAALLTSISRDRAESYRIASTRPYRAVNGMSGLRRDYTHHCPNDGELAQCLTTQIISIRPK